MNRARKRKLFRNAKDGIKDFALVSQYTKETVLNSIVPSSKSPTPHPHSSSQRDSVIFEIHNSEDDSFSSDFSDSQSTKESGSSDSDFEQPKQDTSNELREWAVKHNITCAALRDLLEILNRQPDFNLPKDPRTLLRTPRETAIEVVEPGEYVHFDWIPSVEKLFVQAPRPAIVKIQINIDGIPLYKSSARQFWPILANIVQLNQVIVIGIYSGLGKPANIDNFLSRFANQFISFEPGFSLKFEICAIVCDLPARSFILGTKCHSGYSSCGKCDIKGEYVDNRVTFPPGNYNLRSDESIRLKLDKAHHNQSSIIELLPVNLVEDVPVDFMHLVCLGITRKLLFLWTKGKKCPCRLRFHQVDQLTINLCNIKKSIPKEFARKPRPLKELDHWKATEYRQFLLYSGPIVLKKILTPELYQHFLCLHVAIAILVNPKTYQILNNYAEKLLQYFVNNFGEIYGKKYCSHNLHSLLHLARDSIRHGPLDDFSAFPFENKLQQIKKLVRSPAFPLQQVHRRVVEREQIQFSRRNQCAQQPKFLQPDINSEERSNCFKVGRGQRYKKYPLHRSSSDSDGEDVDLTGTKKKQKLSHSTKVKQIPPPPKYLVLVGDATSHSTSQGPGEAISPMFDEVTDQPPPINSPPSLQQQGTPRIASHSRQAHSSMISVCEHVNRPSSSPKIGPPPGNQILNKSRGFRTEFQTWMVRQVNIMKAQLRQLQESVDAIMNTSSGKQDRPVQNTFPADLLPMDDNSDLAKLEDFIKDSKATLIVELQRGIKAIHGKLDNADDDEIADIIKNWLKSSSKRIDSERKRLAKSGDTLPSTNSGSESDE
ncbi:hypothetical protein Fcan01_19483 [Folsomia candida]|uniref:Transposase domain-containing protein n=1 Tax=Folsomia candida TaxID=158441 RepID=A0A226DLC3_FOLCA|nr:hypothetical protein Fcan01_19483 [Folsomia candida]